MENLDQPTKTTTPPIDISPTAIEKEWDMLIQDIEKLILYNSTKLAELTPKLDAINLKIRNNPNDEWLQTQKTWLEDESKLHFDQLMDLATRYKSVCKDAKREPSNKQ
jgi:hypothetical protein